MAHEGLIKSRKGGKNKVERNTISFQDLMKMSSLNKDTENDEIKEQDDEDDDDEENSKEQNDSKEEVITT